MPKLIDFPPEWAPVEEELRKRGVPETEIPAYKQRYWTDIASTDEMKELQPVRLEAIRLRFFGQPVPSEEPMPPQMPALPVPQAAQDQAMLRDIEARRKGVPPAFLTTGDPRSLVGAAPPQRTMPQVEVTPTGLRAGPPPPPQLGYPSPGLPGGQQLKETLAGPPAPWPMQEQRDKATAMAMQEMAQGAPMGVPMKQPFEGPYPTRILQAGSQIAKAATAATARALSKSIQRGMEEKRPSQRIAAGGAAWDPVRKEAVKALDKLANFLVKSSPEGEPTTLPEYISAEIGGAVPTILTLAALHRLTGSSEAAFAVLEALPAYAQSGAGPAAGAAALKGGIIGRAWSVAAKFPFLGRALSMIGLTAGPTAMGGGSPQQVISSGIVGLFFAATGRQPFKPEHITKLVDAYRKRGMGDAELADLQGALESNNLNKVERILRAFDKKIYTPMTTEQAVANALSIVAARPGRAMTEEARGELAPEERYGEGVPPAVGREAIPQRPPVPEFKPVEGAAPEAPPEEVPHAVQERGPEEIHVRPAPEHREAVGEGAPGVGEGELAGARRGQEEVAEAAPAARPEAPPQPVHEQPEEAVRPPEEEVKRPVSAEEREVVRGAVGGVPTNLPVSGPAPEKAVPSAPEAERAVRPREQPAPARARDEDVRAVEEIVRGDAQARGVTLPDGPVVEAASIYDVPDAVRPEAEFATWIAERHGRRVVFVRATHPEADQWNGLHTRDGKTIVINLGREPGKVKSNPIDAVVGHEFGESLRFSDPDTHGVLVEYARAHADWRRYQRLSRQAAESEATVLNEFVNDFIGEQWHNPGFWNGLAKRFPAPFEKIARKAIDFLTKLINRPIPDRFKAERYLTTEHLRKMRSVVEEAMERARTEAERAEMKAAEAPRPKGRKGRAPPEQMNLPFQRQRALDLEREREEARRAGGRRAGEEVREGPEEVRGRAPVEVEPRRAEEVREGEEAPRGRGISAPAEAPRVRLSPQSEKLLDLGYAADPEGREVARQGLALFQETESAPALQKARKGDISTNQIAKDGGFELLGIKLRPGSLDLAMYLQGLRNPHFETSRVWFMKGDQIVGQAAFTSRLPGISAQVKQKGYVPPVGASRAVIDAWTNREIGRQAKAIHKLRRTMDRLGADGYFLSHNHPRGEPRPSDADLEALELVMKVIPGFRGHVIINHEKYGFISPQVDPATGKHQWSVEDVPEWARVAVSKPYATVGLEHPFGGQIGSAVDLLSMAMRYRRLPDDWFVVVYTGADGTVLWQTEHSVKPLMRIAEELDRGNADEAQRLTKALSDNFLGIKRQLGSSVDFLLSGSLDPKVAPVIAALIKTDVFADAFVGDGFHGQTLPLFSMIGIDKEPSYIHGRLIFALPSYRVAQEARYVREAEKRSGIVFDDNPRRNAIKTVLRHGTESLTSSESARSVALRVGGDMPFQRARDRERIEGARPQVPIEAEADGAAVSRPYSSYAEAMGSDKNPWVRRSTTKSNADRVLMVQFSSPLLYSEKRRSEDDEYYDRLYAGTREGFVRAHDFWEIPQWMGFMSSSFPNADVYVVRNMDEARQFLAQSGYRRVAMSALDMNREYIKKLVDGYDGEVAVGGYVDPGHFADSPNVKWYGSIPELAKAWGGDEKVGVDYRHFNGAPVIPRLTMSDGCLHRCAFCSIPKKVVPADKTLVDEQVEAIAQLQPELVYVNDKTFGQANNYQYLTEVNRRLRERIPGFQGFIVQTTASQFMKIPESFLRESGVRYVEIGVETYNNPILKELHKPATEALIDKTAEKIRSLGMRMIPNIIIGIPGETDFTYGRTLRWLRANKDIISHLNIYNLALYEGTEMTEKLGPKTEADRDENVISKSWHEDPAVHERFRRAVFDFGMEVLQKRDVEPTRPELPPDIEKRLLPQERRKLTAASIARIREHFDEFVRGKEDLREAVRAGVAAAGEYENMGRLSRVMYGKNARRFFALYSAFSPQQEWNLAMRDAVAGMGKFTKFVKKNGRLPTKAEAAEMLKTLSSFGLGARKANAITALTATSPAELLSSRMGIGIGKVPDHARAPFDPNPVTIDGIMSYLLQSKSPQESVNAWRAAIAMFRQIAYEEGLEPRQAQEAGWAWIQAILKRLYASETRTAEIPRGVPGTAELALAREPVLSEDVRKEWSVKALLEDPDVQRLLDAQGLGGRARRLARSLERARGERMAGPVGAAGRPTQEVLGRFAEDVYGHVTERRRAIAEREARAALRAEGLEPPPEPPFQRRREPEIDTPEFKRWFGQSKVVDAAGVPLRMYHGAGQAGVRVMKHGYEIDERLGSAGLYFTPDINEARGYAEQNGLFDDTGLISAWLSLQNPYVTTDKNRMYYLTKPRLDALKRRGYDGVMLVDNNGNIIEAAAFDPSQVKSIENIGAFGPAADMYLQRERPDWRVVRGEGPENTRRQREELVRKIDNVWREIDDLDTALWKRKPDDPARIAMENAREELQAQRAILEKQLARFDELRARPDLKITPSLQREREYPELEGYEPEMLAKIHENIGKPWEMSPAELKKYDPRELFRWYLAGEQRGAPESAMLRVQRAMGGGVLNPIVEDVGDLTHRMAQDIHFFKGGHEWVSEKVNRSLRNLKYEYGFEREMKENITANAKYYNVPEERVRAKVDAALEEYAAEHKKLPVFNKVQWMANEAAIAVGYKNWPRVISLLEGLKKITDQGRDAWYEEAKKLDPDLLYAWAREQGVLGRYPHTVPFSLEDMFGGSSFQLERGPDHYWHFSVADVAEGIKREYAGTGATGAERKRFRMRPDGTVEPESAVIHVYTPGRVPEYGVVNKAKFLARIEGKFNMYRMGGPEQDKLVQEVQEKTGIYAGPNLASAFIDELKSRGYDGMVDEGYGVAQFFRDIKPEEIAGLEELTPVTRAGYQGRQLMQREREKQPIWYSKLERVIEDKMPNAATPEQIRGIVRSGGVRPEEVEWTSLESLLEEKSGKRITKDEVRDWLRLNKVEVEETLLQPRSDDAEAKLNELKHESRKLDREMYDIEARLVDLGLYPLVSGRAQEKLTHLVSGGLDASYWYTENPGAWAAAAAPGGPALVFRNHLQNALESANFRAENDYAKAISSLLARESDYEPAVLKWRDLKARNEDLYDELDELVRATAVPYGEWIEKGPRGAYRTLLLRLPEGAIEHREPHYPDYPNILAFVRFTERVDSDGKKTLFIEEVQSDWHETGRKVGYQDPEFVDKLKRDIEALGLEYEIANIENLTRLGASEELLARFSRMIGFGQRAELEKMPNAPFKKHWPELAMKRMIRWAAENGFDRISWTTGEQQNRRYNLSRVIKSLSWKPADPDYYDKGETLIDLFTEGREDTVELVVRKDGTVLTSSIFEDQLQDKRLEDLIGEGIAEKIMARENGVMGRTDFEIGGKGMYGFYDVMLPEIVGKYIKKWGSKVDEAKVSTMQRWNIVDANGKVLDAFPTYDEARRAYDSPRTYGLPLDPRISIEEGSNIESVHSFDVTPEMRASAMTGQPLFQRGRRGPAAPVYDIPEESVRDMFVRKVAHAFRPVVRAQEIIAGVDPREDIDAALREELWQRRAGARLKKFERDFTEPLRVAVQTASDKGVTYEDVEQYLYARHAPERNAQMYRLWVENPVRNIQDKIADLESERDDMAQEGRSTVAIESHIAALESEIDAIRQRWRDNELPYSGMTNEEAADIMRDLGRRSIMSELDAIGDVVDEVANFKLDTMVKYGLISADEADAMRAAYEHYVPLKGRAETAEDIVDRMLYGPSRPSVGRGFDIRGRMMRALGRTDLAEDVLANLLADAQAAIVRGEKNVVSQAFLNMVREYPDETFWRIDEVVNRRIYDEKTGTVRDVADWLHGRESNVMAVMENGKRYLITIGPTPENAQQGALLVRAMKNLGPEKSGGVVKALRAINQYLAYVNVGVNPEFTLGNFFRDIQTAGINLSAEDTKAMRGAILKNTPRAIRGALRAIRDPNAMGEYERWYREFEMEGGRTQFIDSYTIEGEVKKVADMWKKEGMTKKTAKSVFGLMSDVNSAVENGVRLSAYVEARKSGLSAAKAAKLAANLTVNFTKKGELGPAVNALYLFSNAQIQGTFRLAQAVATSPAIRHLMAGIVVWAFGQAVANRYMMGQDDDGTWIYDTIPDYEKERNMIFAWPDESGRYSKLPAPYGYNVPMVFGYALADLIFNQEKTATQAAASVANAIIGAFSPLGTGTLADIVDWKGAVRMLTPTGIKPGVELALNQDWAGRLIRPEQPPYGPPKPASELYWTTTSPILKNVTAEINRLTGGSEVRPGVVSVSPETLDYLISTGFGGLGKVAELGSETMHGWLTSQLPSPTRMPFVRRFYGEAKGELPVNERFRAAINELRLVEKELKNAEEKGRGEELQRLQEDNKNLMPLIPVAKRIEQMVYRLKEAGKTEEAVKLQKALLRDYREARRRS